METKEERCECVRRSLSNYLDFKALPVEDLKKIVYEGDLKTVCDDLDAFYNHIVNSSVEELRKEVEAGITLSNCPYLDMDKIKEFSYPTPRKVLSDAFLLLSRLHDLSKELNKPFDSGEVIVEYGRRFNGSAGLSPLVWDAVVHPIYFPEENCNVKYDEIGRAMEQ